jgi:hypothetical protein
MSGIRTSSMTLEDVTGLLLVLTAAATHSQDPDVLKVGVVLSALLGAIDTSVPDRAVLDAMANHARQMLNEPLSM